MTDIYNQSDNNNFADDEDDDETAADYDKYLVALLPKPMALLSLIGSYVLIREVLVDHTKKRSKPISHILLMMSIADIFFSLPWFLSTWPAPKDLDYIWGNVGNTATCTVQGFILQLGLMSSPLFNTSLALFYLLMVRYNWTDDRLAKLEKWLHISIWSFALIASIIPIPLGLYNSAWEVCWIDSYPYDCLDSWSYGNDESTCTRGDNAWIWGIAFTVCPVWCCILTCIILMIMIFITVRNTENKTRKYASSIVISNKSSIIANALLLKQSGTTSSKIIINNEQHIQQPPAESSPHNNTLLNKYKNSYGVDSKQKQQQQHGGVIQHQHIVDRKKSNAVARQALWYIAAFLITYSLDLVSTIKYYVEEDFNDILDYFAYALLPLQGFLNFLVFTRTRKQMETPEGRFIKRILCCCCNNTTNNNKQNTTTSRMTSTSNNHSITTGSIIGRFNHSNARTTLDTKTAEVSKSDVIASSAAIHNMSNNNGNNLNDDMNEEEEEPSWTDNNGDVLVLEDKQITKKFEEIQPVVVIEEEEEQYNEKQTGIQLSDAGLEKNTTENEMSNERICIDEGHTGENNFNVVNTITTKKSNTPNN